MGSSGEASNKAIDASVGGLVWVRRRNGSWWPGRILGLDEVSESCVVSPRSGTPVKLLGREDASVDWYNLEKSKRVKAFRCGEYDDCIAKAKATAANSSKKAVKYARREDAIIHALEIESSRLVKDETDASPMADSLSRENGAESPSVSHSSDRNEAEVVGVDNDNDNDDNVEGKRQTPNDSEDEGVKRMRGLEDLGLGVGPKRKVPGGGGGLLELVQQDNASLSDSNNLYSSSNRNGNSSGRGGSSTKRKRTQVANNNASNEFLKKKNRRRPLTKVLESSAAMVEPVDCDQLPSGSGGLSNGKVSELEPTESKKVVSHENGTSVISSQPACDTSNIETAKENKIPSTSGSAKNGSSDRLSELPCVREEKRSAGVSPVVVDSLCEKPQVGGLKREGSQNSQAELVMNETGSTSSEPTVDAYIGQGSSNKWQLKGKRNSRKTTRIRNQGPTKHTDADEESNACLDSGKEIEESNGPIVDEGHEDGSKKSLIIKNTSQRLLPYCQSRFTVHSRYRSSNPSAISSPPDSSLYEVKVEVSANHRSPHVPMVSLMSKLNGKAMVGHPITVELLEDGFFEKAILEAEEEDGLVDPQTGRLAKSGSGNNGRVNAKHMVLQPPPHQRSLRKSPRAKKSGILPKKIRKLSSLNAGKKSNERKSAVAEKPKGPVIACVPLKLVFSRINEAVNGSARKTNRA